jgi:valyl-tRNA synthetase
MAIDDHRDGRCAMRELAHKGRRRKPEMLKWMNKIKAWRFCRGLQRLWSHRPPLWV